MNVISARILILKLVTVFEAGLDVGIVMMVTFPETSGCSYHQFPRVFGFRKNYCMFLFRYIHLKLTCDFCFLLSKLMRSVCVGIIFKSGEVGLSLSHSSRHVIKSI